MKYHKAINLWVDTQKAFVSAIKLYKTSRTQEQLDLIMIPHKLRPISLLNNECNLWSLKRWKKMLPPNLLIATAIVQNKTFHSIFLATQNWKF